MSTMIRPKTSGHTYRPSLTDDNANQQNQYLLSRSFTYNDAQPKQQPRLIKSGLPTPSNFQPPQQQKPRLSRSLLSNDNWREETMVDVRLNSKAIEQSDRNILFGKGIDPLPHVRELLNELSNNEAFLYARQCRVVVAKLRLCWIDVNEEIKSLLKHKEYTEAAIDHIRKDLIINKESAQLRRKPKREAVGDAFAFDRAMSVVSARRNPTVWTTFWRRRSFISYI